MEVETESPYTCFISQYYLHHADICETTLGTRAMSHEGIRRLVRHTERLLAVIHDDQSEGYDVSANYPEGIQERLEALITNWKQRFPCARSGTLRNPSEVPPCLLDKIQDQHKLTRAPPETLGTALARYQAVFEDASTPKNSTVRRHLERLDPTLNKLVNYVHYLLERASSDSIFVCLLRDCLLVHLALVWLGNARREIRSVPLLVSRSYLETFSSAPEGLLRYDDLPSQLEKPIYECLLKEDALEVRFDDLYARRLGEVATVDLDRSLSTTLAIMKQYIPDAPMHIVESGAQGTIPLLLLSLAKGESKPRWRYSDFSMYTCLPWLQGVHENRIFTPEYEHLREIETILCQDQLFKFHGLRGAEFMVTETGCPTIAEFSNAEIRRFGQKIRAEFKDWS